MLPIAQIMQDLFTFSESLQKQLVKTLAATSTIEVGTTPKEVVYQEEKVILYRYKPFVKNPNPIPLLIVYALINRPYLIDLQENRSLINGLLNEGLDVYLIDWGYPDNTDRYLTLNDYINGYLHRCLKTICTRHNTHPINLLGICQGGVLSLCYSALHPENVKNLITLATPVNFKTADNLLSQWLQTVDIDLLVDTLGNVPGELINWLLLSLKPFHLQGHKYLNMLDNANNTEALEHFLRVEKWVFDTPDQAGETFRQFAKDFLQGNGFMAGQVNIGDTLVNLQRIAMPVLNIYATNDPLVPIAAAQALKTVICTQDYTEMVLAGSHIDLFVNQPELPTLICKWLDTRDL